MLIDARHGLKDVDREIMNMLDKAAVSYRLVLTKADKIKPTELAEVIGRNRGGGAQACRRASGDPGDLERDRARHRRTARGGARGDLGLTSGFRPPTPFALSLSKGCPSLDREKDRVSTAQPER